MKSQVMPCIKTIYAKRRMLEALVRSLGIITPAVRVAGISRATHYNWLKSDNQYRDKVSEISEHALDFVETALFQLIGKGNATATIYFLKTKGKNRGYQQSKFPVTQIDFSQLSDSELWNMVRECN